MSTWLEPPTSPFFPLSGWHRDGWIALLSYRFRVPGYRRFGLQSDGRLICRRSPVDAFAHPFAFGYSDQIHPSCFLQFPVPVSSLVTPPFSLRWVQPMCGRSTLFFFLFFHDNGSECFLANKKLCGSVCATSFRHQDANQSVGLFPRPRRFQPRWLLS